MMKSWPDEAAVSRLLTIWAITWIMYIILICLGFRANHDFVSLWLLIGYVITRLGGL